MSSAVSPYNNNLATLQQKHDQSSPNKPPSQHADPPQVSNDGAHSWNHLHQKCVCELCSCGKHKCPKPRLKGIFQTSYKDQFKQFKIQPPPALNREFHYEQRHYNPDQLKTHYQDQYIPKPLAQAPPPIYSSTPALQQEQMSAGEAAQDKGQAPQTPGRFENVAKNMILSPTKFYGSSSYNDHYKGYSFQKPNLVEMVPEYARSPIRFEGTSSYKSTFVPPPPVQSKLPVLEYKHISVPFVGESTYKNHFPGYRVQPMSDPNPEISSPYPSGKAPAAKFQGRTTYKEHFEDQKILAMSSKDLPKKEVCICDVMKIPSVNYNDKPHMRYDITRNQWV